MTAATAVFIVATNILALFFVSAISIDILKGALMSEVQDAVDAITAQIKKGTAEVVTKIADLEAQVAAGEVPDFTELKAAAQALDDLNPDVAPEPTPEPEPAPSDTPSE